MWASALSNQLLSHGCSLVPPFENHPKSECRTKKSHFPNRRVMQGRISSISWKTNDIGLLQSYMAFNKGDWFLLSCHKVITFRHWHGTATEAMDWMASEYYGTAFNSEFSNPPNMLLVEPGQEGRALLLMSDLWLTILRSSSVLVRVAENKSMPIMSPSPPSILSSLKNLWSIMSTLEVSPRQARAGGLITFIIPGRRSAAGLMVRVALTSSSWVNVIADLGVRRQIRRIWQESNCSTGPNLSSIHFIKPISLWIDVLVYRLYIWPSLWNIFVASMWLIYLTSIIVVREQLNHIVNAWATW